MSDTKHECCKCKWVGTESEKAKVPSDFLNRLRVKGHDLACPKCGHKEFYVA